MAVEHIGRQEVEPVGEFQRVINCARPAAQIRIDLGMGKVDGAAPVFPAGRDVPRDPSRRVDLSYLRRGTFGPPWMTYPSSMTMSSAVDSTPSAPLEMRRYRPSEEVLTSLTMNHLLFLTLLFLLG